MKGDSPVFRTLVRLLVRLFPEDIPGVTRSEMEETLHDRCRGEGDPGSLLLLRELWCLLRHGIAERLTASRGPSPVAGFSDDLRFAFRALLRHKAFSLGAVVMLGLGIGLTTAAFSMSAGMSRIVQRFEDPDELVFLWGVEEGWDQARVSVSDFYAWRDETNAFQDMGAYVQASRFVNGGGDPLRIRTAMTTPNLLPMLGFDAEVGRMFGDADGSPSAPPVAVLTWRFWQDRYAGDREILGSTILLNDAPHTIIGVLPAQVEFEMLWRGTSVFTPLVLNPSMEDWEDRSYGVLARLADGSSVEEAQTQLIGVAERLAEAHPETNERVRARVERFSEFFYSGEDKLAIVGIVLAVLAVLLIACVNLANLLLAKGAARQGEMAIRLAMGASRRRMVRQLLTESLILALTGGVIGVFLGQWGLDLLLSTLPNPPFLREEVGLDGTLLTFTFLVSLASALTFGLTPALLSSRVSLSEAVKESSAGGSAGRKRKRLRNWILVTQISLTVPLVLTCGVSYLNLLALQNVDFGFSTEHLLTAEVSLPPHRYPEPEQQRQFFRDALQAVGSVPGVTAAAAGMAVPVGGWQGSVYGPMVVEGRESEAGSARGPGGYQVVSPGYFETLGAPMRSGRAFTSDDGPNDPPVAVVNKAFEDFYWPGSTAIGKRLSPDTDPTRLYPGFDSGATQPVTIVGVVADHGASFYGEALGPSLYLPQDQHPISDFLLVVRSNGDPLQLIPAMREAVVRVDNGVPVSGFRTGEGMVDAWLQESRSIGAMLGIMGVLALGMAILGLYGMVSHSVAQRTFELGLRMVLGADRWSIRLSVMRSFLSLSGVGLAIGIVLAAIFGMVARSFLVLLQVSYVPMTLGIAALMAVVVVVAAYVPARRATSIEPVVALKCE
jgi:putative ABC transport system permease protein